MSDSQSSTDSLNRAREIDERCDELETAWKLGERPRVETLLPKLSPADQLPWLHELLPIEFYYRLKAGEQPRAEEYAARFPALDADWITAQIAEHSSRANGGDLAETVPPNSTHHPGRRRSTPESSAGIVVPEYELIGELGRGAMGVVYKARQLGLGRIVALKMIRASDEAGPEELARFKSEAGAIARLQHPNIVQIYDFGEHEGRPYFSLEFIDGGTLAQKIAGVPQPPRDAARLVETLARAIQQAHVIGIVHRDLKPANVLVTSDGVPKVTDFGLAKQTQADHAATATGMLLGTPQYMAPEQAAGNSSLVGPAADIYALGAILYELLTGRPPFQAANLAELLQAISTREPSSPRLLKRDTPRDLETICLKCLQKLPNARYDSAASLADDLRRFLEDQPILARPISQVERAWRWCRRNPQVAIPSSALAAVLLIVSVASLIAAGRFKSISDQATNSAQDAKRSKLDTQFELALSRINEARMLRRSQRVGQQTEAIAKLIEARDIFRELENQGYAISEDDWQSLRDEAASALLVPDIVTQARWPREPGDLPEVASDLVHQRYVVMKGGAKQAEICRIGTGEVLGSIPAPAGSSFHYGAFSNEGNHLELNSRPDNQIHLWDLSAAPKLIRSMANSKLSRCLSSDGSIFLVAYDNPRSRFIRVSDGQVLAETNLGGPAGAFPLHPFLPWAALRTDLKLIVFDYEKQSLVWERNVPAEVINAAWSHDGRWLAINTKDTLQAFQAPTGEPLPAISAFGQAGIIPISASRAGLLVSADWSGAVRVFDINTSRQRLKTSASFFSWPRSMGAEGSFTLSYEGSDFVVLRPQGSRVTEFGLQATEYCAVSHAGNLAVAYRLNDAPGLYHLPSGELLATLPAAWGDTPLSFEAGDQALLVYGKGSLQRLPLKWTADEPPRLRIGPPQALIVSGMRYTWGMDHSGQVVAVPDFGNGGDIYHLTTDGSKPPALQHTTPQPDVRNAAVSPDGKWAVFGSHVNGKVAVYSTQDARLVRDLVAGGGRGDFSPNGEWLAVGKSAGGGELFRVSDWKSHGNLPGQWSAFSNDGSLLAVINGISTIDIFETARLRRIARLEIQDQDRIMPHTFTPAGDGLVACAFDSRRLMYFDLAGLRSDLKVLDLDWDWPAIIVANRARPPIPKVEIVLTAPQVVSPEKRDDQLRLSLQRLVLSQAAQQQWIPLAGTLEKLCEHDPGQHFNYYQLCILYVYQNDEAGYRRTVLKFREKFAADKDPFIQERLAKAVALGHHWLPVDQHPAEVISTVFVEPPLKGLEDWCLAAAALIDLRRKKYDSALARLERSQPWNFQEFRLQTHIRFLRALAWHGKGERQEAEDAYAEGLDIPQTMFSAVPGRPSTNNSWQDDLVSLIFRREAETALFSSAQNDTERQAFQRSRESKVAPPPLLAPKNDAKLPIFGMRGTHVAYEWDFSWEPVPGAEFYHFALRNTQFRSDFLQINRTHLASTRHTQLWQLQAPPGNGWRWKVRAKVAGRWTAWSEERTLQAVAADFKNALIKPDLQDIATWTPTESKGLTLADEADGHYERIDLDGQACVKALGGYLYFRIDDEFAHELAADDANRYWLEVQLHDGQAVRMDVQFDAQQTIVGLDSRWTPAPAEGFQLRGTQKWLNLPFDLVQPRFGNRQHGGADFRLRTFENGALVVKQVSLFRGRQPAFGE